MAQINDEVAQLTLKVQGKRRQMEDFRVRHISVTLEREENDILGRVKGQTDQSAGLADAREEVNAERDTVVRVAQQASGNRDTLQQFASRFNEFKTMREELAPLEPLLRDATQRKARQDAGETARRPSVRLIEAAFAPRQPWAPQHTRDAAIV